MRHFLYSALLSRLSAEELGALLDGEERLGAGVAGAAAEDELGVQLPVAGDVPLRRDARVQEGVVCAIVSVLIMSKGILIVAVCVLPRVG